MAIDLDALEKELLDGIDDDAEIDEIYRGVEKLKKMSDEDIAAMDTSIYEAVRIEIAGETNDPVIESN